MAFAIILIGIFVGLTAVFTALPLWRRESGAAPGWLASRRGRGIIYGLAVGAGLVVGSHWLLARWFAWFQSEFLGPFTLKVVACLVVLALGATWLILGGAARVDRAVQGKGALAWGAAVALIVTL